MVCPAIAGFFPEIWFRSPFFPGIAIACQKNIKMVRNSRVRLFRTEF